MGPVRMLAALLASSLVAVGCSGSDAAAPRERSDPPDRAPAGVEGGGTAGTEDAAGGFEASEPDPGAGATFLGLARAHASAHPQDVYGASHFGAPEPKPLEIDGESVWSGIVGEEAWARASFRIGGGDSTLTVVLRRPAGSDDPAAWAVADASTAADATLPCRQPAGVRGLWDANVTADC